MIIEKNKLFQPVETKNHQTNQRKVRITWNVLNVTGITYWKTENHHKISSPCPYEKHRHQESISEVTAADIARASEGVPSYEYENNYLQFNVPKDLDVSDESKEDRIKV